MFTYVSVCSFVLGQHRASIWLQHGLMRSRLMLSEVGCHGTVVSAYAVGVISPAEGLVEVNMGIGKPWHDQRLGRRCVLREWFWRMQVAVAPSESHGRKPVSIDLRQRTPGWNLHQAAWNPGLQ